MILGELRRVNGQYGADDLDVIADPDKTIAPAMAAIVSRAKDAGLIYQPRSEPTRLRRSGHRPVGRSVLDQFPVRKEGSIVATGMATFARVRNGELEPFQATPKSQAQELRALCGLRDTLAEVLALQAGSTDDGDFGTPRSDLNAATTTTSPATSRSAGSPATRPEERDPDTGEAIIGRRNPKLGGFRSDPDFPSLLALEVFDPETRRRTKRRSSPNGWSDPGRCEDEPTAPKRPSRSASTNTGSVTLDRVAALLGIEAADARGRLGHPGLRRSGERANSSPAPATSRATCE